MKLYGWIASDKLVDVSEIFNSTQVLISMRLFRDVEYNLHQIVANNTSPPDHLGGFCTISILAPEIHFDMYPTQEHINSVKSNLFKPHFLQCLCYRNPLFLKTPKILSAAKAFSVLEFSKVLSGFPDAPREFRYPNYSGTQFID